MLTANALFTYVEKYVTRAVKADKREVYPSFRQVAKRFNCRYSEIESACNDYCGDGYLGVAVGIQVNGAVGAYATRSEYLVEAYK